MTRGTAMQQRQLGNSGLMVSAVGLGANNFGGRSGRDASRRVVQAALERGITLIDTADAYNAGASEECLGEALGARRKDVVLATKFGMALGDRRTLAGASRRYIMQAAEASLKRLRTDWIDLYQVHRPDPATPIEETLRALDDLRRQGKVRHIGCSNFSPQQVGEAQDVAARNRLAAFVCCQDQYSLLARDIERDLMPAIEARGLGLLPYFPLASGLLTGKYRRDAMPEGARLTYSPQHADRFISARNWEMVEALAAFCTARGRSLIELAFGWLLAKPAVASVIAGASTPEQVEQNVRAAGWNLSADELAEVDRMTS
jgi:aryl-alcohol dehydrogenase-like predicted oxidoreductase